MKELISSVIILSLFLGIGALAQGTDLPSPGLTPDSPFYFLDTLGEKIGMFFTWGAEKKAVRALKYAEEKLAEVKIMAEKNKVKALEKANQKYEKFLNLANQKAQEAKEKGKDIEELAALIAEKALKHQEVLVEVLKKVPEEAKDAIQRAIEVSRKGFETAVQAVTGEKKEELQQKIEEVKVKVETVDWKVYGNKEYGFEAKYPPGWVAGVGALPSNFVFGESGWTNTAKVNITVYTESFIDKIYKEEAKERICTRVVLLVEEAYRCEGTDFIYLETEHNGKFYLWSAFGTRESEKFKIFDQMLSTFKFIEDEIADWETYRNEEYGYEVRYPKTWSVQEISKISSKAIYGFDEDGVPIKYIRFNSPDIGEKYLYYLTFGLKKKGEKVFLSDRTWQGLEELMKVGGKVMIGNKETITYEYVEKGKVKAILYSDNIEKATVEINGFEVRAELHIGESIGHLSTDEFDKIDFTTAPEFKTANQILSTFKFIEDETAGWKTYRDDEYGFEVKYPKKWRVMSQKYDPSSGLYYKLFLTNNEQLTLTLLDSPSRKAPKDELIYTLAIWMKGDIAERYQESVRYKLLGTTNNYDFVGVDDYRNPGKEIFDQILSTFKFIESEIGEEKICNVPKAPVLTDPGISVNKHEAFTLNWTSVSGATKYRLQRDVNPDFSTPFSIPDYWIDYELNSTTGNPNPEVTTTYYYRVKACDDCGCSSWSNVVDMRVIVILSITTTFPNGGESINQESCKIQWDSQNVKSIEILLLVYDENKNQLICYHNPIGTGFAVISEVPIAIFKKAVRAEDGYYLASFKQELEEDCSFVISPAYYKIKLRDSPATNRVEDTSDGYFTISPAPNFKIISDGDEVILRGRINPLNWDGHTFVTAVGNNVILTDNSTKFYLDGEEITFEELKQIYDEMGENKYCPFGSCPYSSLNGNIWEVTLQGKVTIMAKEMFFANPQ